ncbi:hypothetical protein K490DRAFT_75293 [Saccharata proteae CBS 121410]|uniref:WSC domain-containing protein n=1 Tax=Saccharata proteae CBS 121410 TaxID=1314787 RepID=A0A9P4LWM5_9PEZI|nr:hypothetical protein K490DRAFT_75293 [Saccharata proteae CBS 121410]
MRSRTLRRDVALPSICLLALLAGRAAALTQTYCSSQNTGSGNLQDTYMYQSNGHCYDECKSSYAYAIVQGESCWCSNYAPADQVDISNCDTTCPGYGYEDCGSTSDSLYGYLKLPNAASGTQGASSAAATSTTQAATSTVSTLPAPPSSTLSHISTPTSSLRSTIPHESETATPVTQVTLITVSGSIVTQTVTTTPNIGEGANSGVTSKKSVSGGAIAGAVIGGIAGAGLIGALIFWLLLRHRRQKEQTVENGSEHGGTPQRNVSTLSRTGLLRGAAEKDYFPTLPPLTTRNSAHLADSVSPGSERRNSIPLFHDQRLNPTPFMDLPNGSHSSIITIEDNRDYTRTLNVSSRN